MLMWRRFVSAVLGVLILLIPGSGWPRPWLAYAYQDGSYRLVRVEPDAISSSARPAAWDIPATPAAWQIAAAELADVTGDGSAEWVLVVWRPWRDWPIQSWLSSPSPITGFHDAQGDSCHVILLDPADGHEIWAGSALPAPFLALAVGDVNGDGTNEVVTLEGDYVSGRAGWAVRIGIWRWRGFGFKLDWRSAPGAYRELRLTDADNSGILDVAVR